MPVGGATPGKEERAEKRKNTDMEPLSYHGFPKEFYEALCKDNFVKNIIDLSPGPGKLALVALMNRLGYVGIVLTEAHGIVLKDYLIAEVMKGLGDPQGKFYNASYAKAAGIKPEKKSEKNEKGKGANTEKGTGANTEKGTTKGTDEKGNPAETKKRGRGGNKAPKKKAKNERSKGSNVDDPLGNEISDLDDEILLSEDGSQEDGDLWSPGGGGDTDEEKNN